MLGIDGVWVVGTGGHEIMMSRCRRLFIKGGKV
jgi:hypothetical protein